MVEGILYFGYRLLRNKVGFELEVIIFLFSIYDFKIYYVGC